ncbi:Type I restriction modification system, subunit S [Microcystis aeruginosa PCC 9806]|uniref:Restriction endonuclease subunit S n=2 Tax=Microcystis TaxID=1125 RepID=A0A552LIU7_9CHRO|nr:restriction endonuclease subunit S [Microcystis aeruginosa]TRV20153.1 MAG: restriction endonuclease subunit S [Microcystis flos-aquae Mf_WU_F_19750830_S460]CCI15929.1 Type I restriction modification system, subunit S [Microcystis aeruginosa PCC 9806]
MSVEGWKLRRLDEIGEICSGSTPSTNNLSYWDGDITWVTPNDLSKLNTPYLITSSKKITQQGLKSCSAQIVPIGSIILSSRAPIGYLAISLVDCCTNQGCKSFNLNPEYDSEFVYYNLKYNINKIKNLGEGTTFAEISKTALSKIQISFLENKQEQTQIATILSTIDRAIEQTEALITKQQRIKTGLMQDLLTKGIDENGNIRSEETHEFKDSPLGRIPVEWEVKSLQECVEFWDGKRVPLKQSDRDLMQGEIPYYGASGIIDYIDKYIFDEDLILVGEDGENVVSRRLPLCFKITGKSWVNNHAHVLKPVFNANIDFLTERLEFFDYTLLISGSAQPKLNQRNLRNLSFSIPPLSEQKMIASLITNQNRSIKEYETEKEKLMRKKTGLMQDLLTGKVRVTDLLNQNTATN